jgi:hypothetical protein
MEATMTQPTDNASNPNNTPLDNDRPITPKVDPPSPNHAFHLMDVDPNERLPRPSFAADIDFLSQAEQLVSWAISSKHENSPTNTHDVSNNDEDRTKIIEASKCHSLLINLFTKKSDPSLLHAAMHALLSSHHGREFDRLVTHSKLHAQIIHLIMRLDPFVPGLEMSNTLRELEITRRERNERTVKKGSVQIAESSIAYKEDGKCVVPTLPFFKYEIANVHLYLIVALVSSNSLLGVSAVRAIWKLLTGELCLVCTLCFYCRRRG